MRMTLFLDLPSRAALEGGQRSQGWMFISVLICARNRADSLRRTLESLFCSSSLESPNGEVLVVPC